VSRSLSDLAGLRVAACALALAACSSPPPKAPTKEEGTAAPKVTGEACAEVAVLSTAPEPVDATTAPVVRVVVRGTRRAKDACAAIQSRAGAQVSERTVSGDIHRLWDLGFVDDVVVARELAPGGVILAYEIVDLPRFASSRIDGIASAGIGDPADFLPSPGPMEATKIHDIIGRLEDALREQGYRRATVSTRVEHADDEGELVFDVKVGPRMLVRTVAFPGVEPARAGELGRLLVTHPGAPVESGALERDALAVTSYYYDHGMIAAQVHTPRITEDGEAVDVTFEIDEGPTYKIGAVRFTGDLLDREADYKKRFWSSPDKGIVNRSAIAADVNRIREYHKLQGFEADVDVITDVKADKKLVDFTLKVKKR
jgi:outer membrane protein insertion porin family